MSDVEASTKAARAAAPTAVVLAAGAGRRLGDLGRRWSKAMLPIAGRPLIDRVIERLHRGGAADVIVVGHPGDEALAAFLASRHPDVRLAWQPERLGIADAVCRALPLLGNREAFLACACDSLFRPEDIGKILAIGQRCSGEAVVGVVEMGMPATATRSAVLLDSDRIVEIVEKPAPATVCSGTVAAPLYWLPGELKPFLSTPAKSGQETYVSTALNEFIRAGGSVRAFRLAERLEVTTPADAEAVAAVLR